LPLIADFSAESAGFAVGALAAAGAGEGSDGAEGVCALAKDVKHRAIAAKENDLIGLKVQLTSDLLGLQGVTRKTDHPDLGETADTRGRSGENDHFVSLRPSEDLGFFSA
jgi:hypothetical protein